MGGVGMTARRVGGSGYPDHELIDQAGRLTYFETKVSSQIGESSARAFYYSGGKKIKADARHLLIGWEIEEESTRHWKVVGWKLVDLSHLRVSLKTEFNANNPDIYKADALLGES